MNQYEQPIHPMRITTGAESYWFTHVVFAVRVEADCMSFITSNGLIYSSREIAYAETLIAGEWLKLSTIGRAEAS